MTDNKHFCSPWHWNGQSLRGEEHGETVDILTAEFPEENGFVHEHRALISAAPELLEALKQVLAHTERLNNIIAGQNIEFHTSGPWYAAIAKAEGRS